MPRNPLTQLASLGEDVLGKASQNPTAAKLVQSAAGFRDRLDDLTKRVRGLEARKPAASRKTTARASSSKAE